MTERIRTWTDEEADDAAQFLEDWYASETDEDDD